MTHAGRHAKISLVKLFKKTCLKHAKTFKYFFIKTSQEGVNIFNNKSTMMSF